MTILIYVDRIVPRNTIENKCDKNNWYDNKHWKINCNSRNRNNKTTKNKKLQQRLRRQ